MSLVNIQKNKTDKDLNQQETVFNFLSDHKTGVLATVDANNIPHAAVLYYSVDESLCIRFMTKRRTRNSENLTCNNNAALVVYDEARQATVQVTGTVIEVNDEDQSREAFSNSLRSSLHTAHNAIPPISRLDAGEYVTYKLIPTELKMTVYKRQGATKAGSTFEVVDLPQVAKTS